MNKLNELDELILEKLGEYVPDSYVKKQEKWIRDAHSGDYREIAHIEEIPLEPENADKITKVTAQDMASLYEEYGLEDISPLSIGGENQ